MKSDHNYRDTVHEDYRKESDACVAEEGMIWPGYTPGPRIVYDSNEGDGVPPLWCVKNEALFDRENDFSADVLSEDDEPAFDCTIHCGTKDDAHLIAAAPDLFEILKEITETFRLWSSGDGDGYVYERDRELLDKARAALAKANPEPMKG
jgi:hypothetical protein